MVRPLRGGTDTFGWLIVRELRVDGAVREVISTHRQSLVLGDRITIGQQASVPIGAEPLDRGVSRFALAVAVTDRGWDLEFNNRNGHTIYRWATQPEWVTQGARRLVRWPRVGILVAGLDTGLEHWLLLESDEYEIDCPADGGPRGSAERSVMDTVTAPRPTNITPMQRAAVQVIFGDHLSWPPVANPVARSLDSARHRLGVGSESAVKARLQPVRERAYARGLTRQVGLTDPAYIYHLAELGYFTI